MKSPCKEAQTDRDFMRLAFKLAENGIGSVEPNPVVGCVIVKDGLVIGSGFHEKFGGPHAEINALADCRKNSFDPAGASAYVSLEPCCHIGKTGPCTQALIEAKIAKVFVAAIDPTEKVNGKGAAGLRAAGIEVDTGLCTQEAQKLNAPFFKHALTGKPWVILKWAQSIDGKLARKNRDPAARAISGQKSRLDAHHLRKRVQGILVGIETVIADNPSLTVRVGDCPVDRPPLRIVLDSNLRIPWDCNLITTSQAPTLIVTTEHTAQIEAEKVEKLRQSGVGILRVAARGERCDIKSVLEYLGKNGVGQLLVEGGPTILASFLKEGLADECVIYIAPEIFGAKGDACITTAFKQIDQAFQLEDVTTNVLDEDVRISGLFPSGSG